jgi:hypothetical protein
MARAQSAMRLIKLAIQVVHPTSKEPHLNLLLREFEHGRGWMCEFALSLLTILMYVNTPDKSLQFRVQTALAKIAVTRALKEARRNLVRPQIVRHWDDLPPQEAQPVQQRNPEPW